MPAHRLGPSVVGQRVVVRYLLDDGRATDVLGTCTSWDDSGCVIRRDRAATAGEARGASEGESEGEIVSVPLERIVTGKPVPPRASVRRRVSVRDAELHTAGLAHVESTPLGEWQLRYEPSPVGRIRNRFNSCLGIGDPGLPVADAAERVREFYAARDRPPRIQVELGSATEGALRELGWVPVPGRDSVFLLASVAQVRRRLPPADLPVGFRAGQGVVDTGVAVGRCGLEGDWVGIHDLVVDPGHRRQGLARRVIAALLEAAAEQGATTAWLHVETGNAPALALYDSLGFTEHHRCRYCEPASATD